MSFLVFLKSFLFIRDKDLNSNFDQYIYQVTGGTIQMGVIETNSFELAYPLQQYNCIVI